MDARITPLEERTDLFGKQLDRIITRLDALEAKFDARFDALYGRLDAMSERMSRLPSKDFLIATIAVILGAAIGIAALTFQIADYVGSRPTPTGPATTPAPVAAQQPLVIVIPPWQAQQASPPSAPQGPAQPAPSIAPEPPKP